MLLWGGTLAILAVFCAASLWGATNLARSAGDYHRIGEALVLSLFIWLALLALFSRVWLVMLVALPAALLLPFEIWLLLNIGSPSTAQTMALVFETSTYETMDFFRAYGSGLVLLWLPWATVYLLVLGYSRTMVLAWRHPRSRVWFLSLLVGVAVWLVVSTEQRSWLQQEASSDAINGMVFSGWSQPLRHVFPISALIAVQEYRMESSEVRQLQTSMKEMALGGRLVDARSAPDIVVLVIGESSTASHWELLGYERETNPRLRDKDNLLIFSDVVGLSVRTRSAVPGVLSRRPILRMDGKVDLAAEPSLITAFSEAGYTTHWISNQSPFGRHDTSVAVHAGEADHVVFLNPSRLDYVGHYDEVLLPSLRRIIGSPGRHLVILHTLGSHFDFSMRYPVEHEYFKPASKGDRNIEQLRNAYDNSVRYTDFFIGSVIELLQVQAGSVLLAYFSDHGVDVPGDECTRRNFAADRSGESSYHVPVLFWGNDEFYRHRRYEWANLKTHVDMPYTTRAMYSTLLALSGVVLKVQDEGESFLNPPNLAEKPRLVGRENSVFDFDAAKARNNCRIEAEKDEGGV